MNQLIITNGSAGIDAIRNAGIEGNFLSWDDLLHDGPVPTKASLQDLSDIRADFIANRGWGQKEEVRAKFRERDDRFLTALNSSVYQGSEIILWFEHDLYDQLQLIQILFEIGRQTQNHNTGHWSRITMICHDRYIGMTAPDLLAADYESRRAVTTEEIKTATTAWVAFTSSDPEALPKYQENKNTGDLPFLPGALNRLLEEFPDAHDGLSRTERTILQCLADSSMTGGELFRAQQKTEEAIFLGDGSFEHILKGMLTERRSLISASPKPDTSSPVFPSATYEITEDGVAVLEGAESAINHAEKRWIGGCQI